LLEIKEAAGEDDRVTQLGRVSPIAWQYINFHGRFEFLDPPAPIDLKSVVQELTRGSGLNLFEGMYKNNQFEMDVSRYCNLHRVALPYKKKEQYYIESFD